MTTAPKARFKARAIKPVVTLDPARLEAEMLRLWETVKTQTGSTPDAVVGIAAGGFVCAKLLEPTIDRPILSCAMRRASSHTKDASAATKLLRHIPYGLSNWLRRVEDVMLARKTARSAQKIPAPTEALKQDIAAIVETVGHQGARHILVIDDAVDSGATLACVHGALKSSLQLTLQSNLDAAITLTTAVVTQTRPDTLFAPDIVLHEGALCRFPWSHDFRG